MGALTLACGWAGLCYVLLCLPFFSKSGQDMCPVPDSGLSPGAAGSRVCMALVGVELWLEGPVASGPGARRI